MLRVVAREFVPVLKCVMEPVAVDIVSLEDDCFNFPNLSSLSNFLDTDGRGGGREEDEEGDARLATPIPLLLLSSMSLFRLPGDTFDAWVVASFSSSFPSPLSFSFGLRFLSSLDDFFFMIAVIEIPLS